MSLSNTELAARLRLLADWIDEHVWDAPELNDAPKTIHEAAAALESPERVQGEAMPVAEVAEGKYGNRLMWHTSDAQESTPVGTLLYTATPSPRAATAWAELTFEQIEACFPEGGGQNEYGECVVPAQWLHDFARNVAALRASTPAERVPLTDEQIASIVRKAAKGSAITRDGSTSHRIARAIERAHGIVTKESST